MKNQIKKIVFAVALLTIGLSGMPNAAKALDWTVGVDGNGNLTGAVGSSGTLSGYGGWGLSNPYGLPQGSILGILSNLLFWLLSIFAIMGVIGFVISGIIYLVSAGDDTTIERAKTTMKYSILGIIVGLSGFVIMQAVASLLGGASKNF
jgi:hypothetical protein